MDMAHGVPSFIRGGVDIHAKNYVKEGEGWHTHMENSSNHGNRRAGVDIDRENHREMGGWTLRRGAAFSLAALIAIQL